MSCEVSQPSLGGSVLKKNKNKIPAKQNEYHIDELTLDTEIVAEQRQNCFIMDDDATFEQMLLSMRIQNKRDPRSIRLAAVTAAIVEIVGEELSPTKVYASTVTTLEGTLKLEGSDSLSTQVALLELLR